MHRIRLWIRPPRGFRDSVSIGGTHLRNSIVAAVEGVVVRPMHGYQDSGFSGAIVGIVGGCVAIGTKPTQGIVDLCSTVCNGLIAVIHGPPESGRIRPPRVVISGILSAYNSTVSHVYDLFCHLNIRSGSLSINLDNEYYVSHANSSFYSTTYLITTVRILCMLQNRKWVTWSFPLAHIRSVTAEPSCVFRLQTVGGRCLNTNFLLQFQNVQAMSDFVGVIKDRTSQAEIAPGLLQAAPTIHKSTSSFSRRKATISFPLEIRKQFRMICGLTAALSLLSEMNFAGRWRDWLLVIRNTSSELLPQYLSFFRADRHQIPRPNSDSSQRTHFTELSHYKPFAIEFYFASCFFLFLPFISFLCVSG